MCHCRLTLHIQLLLAQSRGLQGHRNDSHWKTRIVGGVIKIQESRTCLKASAIVQCLKPCFDTALKSQDVKRRKSSNQTFAAKPAHCAETRHQHLHQADVKLTNSNAATDTQTNAPESPSCWVYRVPSTVPPNEG